MSGRSLVSNLRAPIVQAPLAGGASTPALAAAVAAAGGLGFLAGGYKTAAALGDDIRALRALTSERFGVNVFAPPAPEFDRAALASYAECLAGEAARYGVALGEPRHDDDGFDAKLDLLVTERVAIVSFTFGAPAAVLVERLHGAGCEVWVTVTNPDEAAQAASAGADVLVAQGIEAGGHRGYFVDDADAADLGLLTLLRLLAARVELPLVAAGGIADGAGVASVLCAGAAAAQIGSALMLTPEAGTSAPHREALRRGGPTALTRAFSGRQARGITNRFMRAYEASAPSAYPDVHHLTTPIRTAARAVGDADAINLWAGQAYTLTREAPAADIVGRLVAEAREAANALVAALERDVAPLRI